MDFRRWNLSRYNRTGRTESSHCRYGRPLYDRCTQPRPAENRGRRLFCRRRHAASVAHRSAAATCARSSADTCSAADCCRRTACPGHGSAGDSANDRSTGGWCTSGTHADGGPDGAAGASADSGVADGDSHAGITSDQCQSRRRRCRTREACDARCRIRAATAADSDGVSGCDQFYPATHTSNYECGSRRAFQSFMDPLAGADAGISHGTRRRRRRRCRGRRLE